MTFPGGEYPTNGPQPYEEAAESHPPIKGEIVDDTPQRPFPMWPLILYLATCYTTYSVGGMSFGDRVGDVIQFDRSAGLIYSAALMITLTCHEFGHYLQALRYRVPASLPYFIPIPAQPLGTMGAVIGMRGNSWNRKELFDIGISGPLAGLVPTLIFCVIGLQQSTVIDAHPPGTDLQGHGVGAPLLFQFLGEWVLGPLPAGKTIGLGPLAFAGWVGMFITALNLMPISQLDGGHVLYALLRRKSYVIATLLLGFAILAVLWTQNYQWSLMLFLLLLIGPNHPPTADDKVPLGTGRIVLGWLTLSFVIIGFTPTPFM